MRLTPGTKGEEPLGGGLSASEDLQSTPPSVWAPQEMQFKPFSYAPVAANLVHRKYSTFETSHQRGLQATRWTNRASIAGTSDVMNPNAHAMVKQRATVNWGRAGKA